MTVGHFTFWTGLSLSPKFKLTLKISQKVKSFFVWTQRIAHRFAKTKLQTERSLNPKLINSSLILHAQNRLIKKRLSSVEQKSLHIFANSKMKKYGEIGDESPMTSAITLVSLRYLRNSGRRPKLNRLVSVFCLGEFKQWNDPACINGRQSRVPMYDRHNDVGGASIKSRGWFVEEQDRWRRYELHANVDTFTFTARHSTNKLITNLHRS